MKKLTTIILGLGLMLGSTLMANDTTSTLSPADNEDTPDYILTNSQNYHSKVINIFENSAFKKNKPCTLYPVGQTDRQRDC